MARVLSEGREREMNGDAATKEKEEISKKRERENISGDNRNLLRI